MKFAFKTLAVTALLLLAWAGYVKVARPNQALFGQNFIQRNLIKVQECLYHTPDKPVFLAGSSITLRFPNESLGPEFVNWGLGGDNALTCVEIIRRAGLHPKLVLVERSLANLESTGPQLLSALFSPTSRFVSSKFTLFEERYQPATVLLGWIKSRPQASKGANWGTADRTVDRWLATTQEDFTKPADPALIKNYLDSLKQGLEILRAEGIRIVFYDVPFHPSLIDTPKQAAADRAFEAVFPSSEWPRIRVNNHGDYVTDDGVHLVKADAEKFSRFLRNEALVFLAAPGNDETFPKTTAASGR
jgi:hypothetical protein